MDEVKQMSLVGFYNFSSKDKTKKYFVIQALCNEIDKSQNTIKSNIINIFTDENIYNSVIQKQIGSLLNVKIKADLINGKVYYNIVND